jgi:methylaspartate mutase epsilon subunit
LYDRSQRAIDRAAVTGEQLLNGFPVVNYGLRSREVFSAVDIPVHISGNVDEEAMLSSEMAFASGCTCDFAHSLHDLVQHSRDYDLARRIQCDQYISHLAGIYTANGAPIEILTLANYQGLIPPSLGMAVAILDLLISAAQGVKYFSLHRCCEGNLVQDVAAFNAYRVVARDYADRFALDVDLVTHAWPWMGAWPYEPDQNAGLVAWCASIAMLGGVDWIYLKSTHEGSGIPSAEANISALNIARQLRRIVPNQGILQSGEIDLEQHMMELEIRAIVDKALELGDGDPARGLVAAVAAGAIDIPIASWSGVADRVVAARDANGAVRFADPGGIPLPPESLEFHRVKMAERRARDGIDNDINIVIADIRQYMDESV